MADEPLRKWPSEERVGRSLSLLVAGREGERGVSLESCGSGWGREGMSVARVAWGQRREICR